MDALGGQTDRELKAGGWARRGTRRAGCVSTWMLAWPDTCFPIRDGQASAHPQSAGVPRRRVHRSGGMPKEREMIDICREGKSGGSQGAGFTGVYTRHARTTSRYEGCSLGAGQGFKVATDLTA